MVFITENTIEQYIEKYENQETYLNDLKIILFEQPNLMAFIDQENHTLLTKDEVAVLEYLTLVIYNSAKSQCGKNPILSGIEIEKSEEVNWELFNSASSKSFSKILDVFFSNYEQEDLLALVEDTLQPDEENPVTSVGREIIFVACKSIIDTLHTRNK